MRRNPVLVQASPSDDAPSPRPTERVSHRPLLSSLQAIPCIFMRARVSARHFARTCVSRGLRRHSCGDRMRHVSQVVGRGAQRPRGV